MYATVHSDSSIGLGAADLTFRHVAERAVAVIAVLASDNASENIGAAAKLPDVYAASSSARTANAKQMIVNATNAMLSKITTVASPVPTRLNRNMSTCHVIGLIRAVH